MATPKKKNARKYKVNKVVLSKQDQLEIMDLLTKKTMTAVAIARKYNVTSRTIFNVRNRLKEDFDALTFYMPGPVIDRKTTLSTEERIAALADDAASVMELSMNLAKFKLERDMKFMQDNPTKEGILTMKEVTDFFDKSASYVLQKKTANIKQEPAKPATGYSGKLHKLFEQQTQNVSNG